LSCGAADVHRTRWGGGNDIVATGSISGSFLLLLFLFAKNSSLHKTPPGALLNLQDPPAWFNIAVI